jgi:chorismate dehydratase
MAQLRFGLFPYLNVRPLLWGLRSDPRFFLVLDSPARVAERFRNGELDLAFVPSFEAASMGVPILDGLAIGSDGPVETVLLGARRPLSGVRRIALDEASRTSAALARVLVAEAAGAPPEVVAWRPDAEVIPDNADAALVIGDPAFRVPFPPSFSVHDLGEAWRASTSLPFVYAVIVARTPDIGHAAAPAVRAALRTGLADLGASLAAHPHFVGPERATRYLTQSIRYEFGPREHAGLTMFLARARAWGLGRGDSGVAAPPR